MLVFINISEEKNDLKKLIFRENPSFSPFFLSSNRVFVILPVDIATQFFENGEKSKTMQNKSKLPSKYSNSGQLSPISTNIKEFIDKNILENAIFEQNFRKFQNDGES